MLRDGQRHGIRVRNYTIETKTEEIEVLNQIHME
jgi:hypothetical protein